MKTKMYTIARLTLCCALTATVFSCKKDPKADLPEKEMNDSIVKENKNADLKPVACT
ncbi:hypothetical protein [Flavobacterium sp. 3HN19-14]|uniref:hypothetical protein n=1 Tax=Flavobacterium sp. 3HN19-14 TaxID=3448133 RepID=UPI003EE298F6